MHSIWDKLEWRERATLLGVYAASLVLVSLLSYGWGRSAAEQLLLSANPQASSDEVIDLSEAQPAPTNTESPAPEPPAPSATEELVVHVSGAVKKAGVYRLARDSRVVDAIEQAGGATASADLNALNLAEPLTDGQKVHVPRKGETPPSASAAAASTVPSARTTSPPKATPKFPIDLNTATAEQLEAIPGIGPVLAQRIVEYRNTHGKFHSVDDLLEVQGIGPKRLENMRPYVTVH
ncbi:MAG: ComEA family DNA-binding protein [Fimbriimonadales bacterium]|nr:ComEA family DNA-binding protein [Fimbriimonadales bacterium]